MIKPYKRISSAKNLTKLTTCNFIFILCNNVYYYSEHFSNHCESAFSQDAKWIVDSKYYIVKIGIVFLFFTYTRSRKNMGFVIHF
jgi:hypothetical protein